MIRINHNQAVAVMQNGDLLFPESKEDWTELKDSMSIASMFSSSSQILKYIKISDFRDEFQELLDRYQGEKDNE